MNDNLDEFLGITSEPAKIAMLIIGYSGDIKSTRLQKLSLVAKGILDGKVPISHGAYLFEGYSDDIDESTETMRSEGFLNYEAGKGFYLSGDGKKLFLCLSKKEPKLNDVAKKVSEMFKGLSDRQVTAVTYKLFSQLTENPIIKEEMIRIGENINIETFKLKDKQ